VVDEELVHRRPVTARLHVSQPGFRTRYRRSSGKLRGPAARSADCPRRRAPDPRRPAPSATARPGQPGARRAGVQRGRCRASGVDAGELHVGTLYSISVGVLPAALRTWRGKVPGRAGPAGGVPAHQRPDRRHGSRAGRPGRRPHSARLGRAGLSGDRGRGCFVVAAAPGHPAAGYHGRPYGFADLADRDWVHFYFPRAAWPTFSTPPAPTRASCPVRRCAHRKQAPSAAVTSLRRAWAITLYCPAMSSRRPSTACCWRPDPPVQSMHAVGLHPACCPDPITAAFVDGDLTPHAGHPHAHPQPAEAQAGPLGAPVVLKGVPDAAALD